MKLKLLFAINNLCAGGAERVMSALINELSKSEQLDLHLVCFHASEKFAYFYHVNETVAIHLIEFGNIEQLETVISHVNPNCVVSFLNPMNYMCSVAAHKEVVPHIACERNNPFQSPYREDDRNRRDEAFFNAEGCVFQTKEAAEYFINRIKGDYTIIINPVCLYYSEYANVHTEHNSRIVTVGRFAEQKNYKFLVDVFSLFKIKHPEFVLECYGKDSGDYPSIKQYISDMGLEDSVFLNRETPYVHNHIKGADAFLFTPEFEGTPNALMEAAVLGIPCVASDIPEIRAINREHPFAVLCSLSDPKAFVNALERVIYDKRFASSLIMNAEIMASARDVNSIAKQWLNFIVSIVDKTRS